MGFRAGLQRLMPQRNNLNTATEELEKSLDFGRNSKRVARSFWRRGLRYGRRGVDSMSIEELVRSSVAEGASVIVGEFLKLRSEKVALRLSLEDRLVRVEQRNDEFPFVEPELIDEPIDAGPALVLGAILGSPGRNHGRNLDSATKFREQQSAEKKRRYELDQRRMVAERARQRQAKIESDRQAHLNEIQSLREQIITLNQEMSEAPRIYGQKFLRLKEQGAIYWARFCDGFDTGRSRIRRPHRLRRKARDEARARYEEKRSVRRPAKTIVFDIPSELQVNG